MYILEYLRNNMGQCIFLYFCSSIGLPLLGLINLAYKVDKLAQIDKKKWIENKNKIRFCFPSEKNRRKIKGIINKNSTYNSTQLNDLSKVIIRSFRATIVYFSIGLVYLITILALWVIIIISMFSRDIMNYPTELGILLGSGIYGLFVFWEFYGRGLAETFKLYKIKEVVDRFVVMILDKVDLILDGAFTLILAGASLIATILYMGVCNQIYMYMHMLNYRIFMFAVIVIFYFYIVPKILSKICIKIRLLPNNYLKYSNEKICKKLMNNSYLNLLLFYLFGIFQGKQDNIILVIIGAVFLLDTYIDRENQLKKME